MKIYLEGQIYNSHTQPVAQWIEHEFRTKGTDFFKQLDGCFLLAITNEDNNEFFLVRDAVGEHPVHYLQDNPRIFSSSLTTFKPFTKTIDSLGCDMALRKHSGLVGSNYPTLLSGVHSLSPGHFLHIKKNQMTINCYWNPFPVPVRKNKSNSIDPVEQFRKLLKKAIEKRCSNKNTTFLVSGGLDSSSLLSIAVSDLKMSPLVISYNSGKFKLANELNYQKLLINKFNLNHVSIDTDVVLNSKAEYLKSQVINGEGIIADPIYPVVETYWKIAKLNSSTDLVFGIWGDQVMTCLEAFLDFRNLPKLLKFIVKMEPTSRFAYLKNFLYLLYKNKSKSSYYFELLKSPYHLFCIEQNFKLAKSNRVKHHYPFLDKDLLEFLINLPNQLHVQNGEWKSLLKKSINDLLPQEILNRQDKADYTDLLCQTYGFKSLQDLWKTMDQNALRLFEEYFLISIENSAHNSLESEHEQ